MFGVSQKLLLSWGIVLLTTTGTTLFILTFSRFASVTTFLFSWTLNFSLMFWISVVELQLKPALNSNYFQEYSFEKRGKIYEKLGIHWFRKLLVLSGWEKLSQKKNPIKKNLATLLQSERATRVSEFGHLIIAVLIAVITLTVCFQYSVTEARWLVLLNILLNVYPILVQRYNRPRLHRIIKKLQQPVTV